MKPPETIAREGAVLDRNRWRSSAIDPQAFGAWFMGGYTPTEFIDGVAVVYVCGPLDHHQGWMFDSYDSIVCRLEGVFAEEDVRAVVMCFDTPGGDASGVEEAHRKIKALRAEHGKPVFAYSNESCYSAGYWLASACDEIWLPRTGGVGSVGVIAEAVDMTGALEKAGVRIELVTTGAQKADGHPERPLTDDILARVQDRVDAIGEIFFGSVAEARGLKPTAVVALQAGTFMGEDATRVGLADGVSDFDSFMETVRAAVGFDSGNFRATTTETSMEQKLLALTAAVTTAEKALASAKSDEERATASATLASALEAKVKYSKRTRTDEVEEDDGEEDAPESEKSGKDDEDKDEDAEGDSDEDAESEEDAGADEGDDASKARSKALAALGKDPVALASFYDAVSGLTGQRDPRAAIGALAGITERLSATAKLEKRIAKLESGSKRERVDAMLSQAHAKGKIVKDSPAAEQLRAQGMKDPTWLKGYLASLAPVVRTTEEGNVKSKSGDAPGVELSIETMDAEERAMYQAGADALGISLEKYLEAAKATVAKMAPAAPRH